jgi:hypothetical protein
VPCILHRQQTLHEGISMNGRTNVARVFLNNNAAIDIEVAEDFDCAATLARLQAGGALVGKDYYISADIIKAVVRLYAMQPVDGKFN